MNSIASSLSPAQRSIWDLATSGKSRDSIKQELGLSDGILNAQVTRIKNKGLDIVFAGNPPANQPPNPPVGKPPGFPKDGVTDDRNDIRDVLDKLDGTGQAVYNIEATIKQAQEQGRVHGPMADLHPMAMFGITIQFMRLAGGRMHAHQVIEDIYGALRTFNHDGPAPEIVTSPLGEFDLKGVKNDLEELLAKLPGNP